MSLRHKFSNILWVPRNSLAFIRHPSAFWCIFATRGGALNSGYPSRGHWLLRRYAR